MCGRGIRRPGRLPPHGKDPLLRVRRVQHLCLENTHIIIRFSAGTLSTRRQLARHGVELAYVFATIFIYLLRFIYLTYGHHITIRSDISIILVLFFLFRLAIYNPVRIHKSFSSDVS